MSPTPNRNLKVEMQAMTQWTISRVPGPAPGRSSGTAFGPFVWSVAAAGDHGVDIGEQSQRTLEELDRLLAASGTSKDRLLSVSVYLADMDDKPVFDEIWAAWIGPNPEHWPQRACVGASLANDMLVELVAIAARQAPS